MLVNMIIVTTYLFASKLSLHYTSPTLVILTIFVVFATLKILYIFLLWPMFYIISQNYDFFVISNLFNKI